MSKKLSMDRKKSLVGMVYISPFYILFLAFAIFPIISGFYISFFRWDGLSIMRFLGLDNYINVIKDKLFRKALANTLIMGIGGHIPVLAGGLVLAYILNSKLISFKDGFKLIYFLPMVTGAVATSIIFQFFFGNNYGILNAFFRIFGGEPVNWLGGDGSRIKIAVIVMFAWKWTGWNMVIYLAGMQGISEDIYEAAIIDGANHTQIFYRITIPLIRPIILFTLVTSTIGIFNLFTEPFILTNSNWQGGPNNGGLTLMMYLLRKAPQGGNAYGYAASIAYIITIMIIIISLVINKLMAERD